MLTLADLFHRPPGRVFLSMLFCPSIHGFVGARSPERNHTAAGRQGRPPEALQ